MLLHFVHLTNFSIMTPSQSHKGEQGIICDKLVLTRTNSDVNLANGLSAYDGYEMWEVSNTFLVEGEHKDITIYPCSKFMNTRHSVSIMIYCQQDTHRKIFSSFLFPFLNSY